MSVAVALPTNKRSGLLHLLLLLVSSFWTGSNNARGVDVGHQPYFRVISFSRGRTINNNLESNLKFCASGDYSILILIPGLIEQYCRVDGRTEASILRGGRTEGGAEEMNDNKPLNRSFRESWHTYYYMWIGNDRDSIRNQIRYFRSGWWINWFGMDFTEA